MTPNINMGKRKTKVLWYVVTQSDTTELFLFYFITSHDHLGLPDAGSAVIDPDLHIFEMQPLGRRLTLTYHIGGYINE